LSTHCAVRGYAERFRALERLDRERMKAQAEAFIGALQRDLDTAGFDR
jgi:hypothetical protein